MAVTIRDIAEHLNLSISTISRSLNGYKDVSPSTRERISNAAREIGYYPSDAARSLRRQRTNRIGLLIPSFSDFNFIGEYFSEIIRGITFASAKAGCNLMLYPTLTDELGQLTRICRAREVDGVILISSTQLSKSITFLKQETIPFVIIGHPVDDPNVSFIASDNMNGNLIAMRHLIEIGHTRIAYIARYDQPWINAMRISGYQLALDEANISLQEELIIPASSGARSGYKAMNSILSMKNPSTAVLAFNDLIAINALQVAHKHGLEIPKDVAIVGYNDILSSLSTTPQLTSVHQPLPEMGQAAVETLLAQVSEKDHPPERKIIPVHLVVRQSTVEEHSGARREN